MEPRPRSFYILAAFFGLFVLFLYGPTITIGILSFQGPERRADLPDARHLAALVPRAVPAAGGRRHLGRRSAAVVALGLMVMVTTVVVSVMGGLAFRKRFAGSACCSTSSSPPGDPVDPGLARRRPDLFARRASTCTGPRSAFGAQLTWTLPFGLLIMFAVFNRFDPATRRRRAIRAPARGRRCAMSCCRSSRPSLIGVALFGFTLSYDEFARTLLTSGSHNTLPLEIYGMTTNVTTPVLYALGTLTTLFSFAVIGLFVLTVCLLHRRRARAGSDAGKGMV